jgi:hypothetical protein
MRRVEAIFLAVMVTLPALIIPVRGQEKEPADNSATQEQAPTGKAAKEEQVRRVIQLKYADPGHVAVLLTLFGASLRWDGPSKVLTVVGPTSAVAAVEEAVKKLDVPPPPTKDVDLTAYFVLATRQPMQASDLPPELGEVVTQLKRVLNYQSFQLVNTAFLRIQEAERGAVSGVARVGSEPVEFHLSFDRAEIIPEAKARTVRISGLDFVAEQATTHVANTNLIAKTTTAKIHTNIDIAEGQKVVVGKTALDFPDNALILVLTAKVID